ncbi:LabA-like NYN domain-containing protein [Photobacterium sanguinicancri]|uniref:NYN domain-containing protein n=1 Tax=Photobacterium sanguinicancri TaxID=875932 RepID=A0AAW7Y5A8_9GAMM|nr:NYN domain-containing protein [Photobacterium sanguinicancri]KXI22376.1 nuclease [Photobacterium sanguinicancri]MDO6498554.1 NYN domain-containing protein [Photobacterium sanguinicancri]MDO6542981.1 NYN domain-containing protein [Photobacterium sanguinicancri]
MEKVAIFVDVQNIYYTVKEKYHCNFDYNAFWAEATQGREVVAAYAYAIHRGDEKQRQFQNILRGIGFEVKLKPFIQRSDGSAKGDWDVGITLDVVEHAPDVDRVILLSGDGDFDLLVDKVQTKFGASVEIYGVPGLTATSLQNTAHFYREIEQTLLLGR